MAVLESQNISSSKGRKERRRSHFFGAVFYKVIFGTGSIGWRRSATWIGCMEVRRRLGGPGQQPHAEERLFLNLFLLFFIVLLSPLFSRSSARRVGVVRRGHFFFFFERRSVVAAQKSQQ